MNMRDPTREEMRDALALGLREFDESDIEEAIYWFASDWHGGQGTNLYEVLSTSPYQPGPLRTCVTPDSMAAFLYEQLETEFEIP